MSSCRLYPHSSHPSNLQDRTSARLLTPPFHGGAESCRQMREQRDLTSSQTLHGKPYCLSMQPPPQSGVLLCAKHNHLAPHSITWYQPLISGCRVYWTTSHSHDTSPSSAAAMCTGQPLIHMVTAQHRLLLPGEGVGTSVKSPGKRHHDQWGSPQAVSKFCVCVR